jgi:hypothetical protein
MLMAFNNPGVAVLSQCASLVRPAVGLPPRACSPGRYSQRGKWDDTKKTCSKGSMQNPLNEERGVGFSDACFALSSGRRQLSRLRQARLHPFMAARL